MSIDSLKSNADYAKDLQSALTSNPLKKDNTSADEREANVKEMASKVDAKTLMSSYVIQFQMSVTFSSSTSFTAQGAFGGESALNDFTRLGNILNGLDLGSIGYDGKPLQELTQDEAKALISDDGFFGIPQTSARIADFVLAGAGDDVEKLKAGREGILRGYQQAQRAWGGELPELSQKTLDQALEKVDKKLESLGVNVLDENA